MFIAESSSIKIRHLLVEDVYAMRDWGKHDDPLFYDYNFPKLNDMEVKEWFNIKTGRKSKKCYSILDNFNRTIGYLTIKDIKKFKKSATLGIVFDPNFINKGFGTETINLFLDYFFNKIRMRTMYLEVAKFNKRALRCYEKCGFEIIDEYKEKIDNDDIRIYNLDKYVDTEYFFLEDGDIYCFLYQMKIEHKKFCEMREALASE
ncbi:MAG: GNAT family N-acetyltransferase [Firmicutes bacterium]|nr:GNAT family N-acetyltransferase [Bacillota bacterium]